MNLHEIGVVKFTASKNLIVKRVQCSFFPAFINTSGLLLMVKLMIRMSVLRIKDDIQVKLISNCLEELTVIPTILW
jgi:hypothetical protein